MVGIRGGRKGGKTLMKRSDREEDRAWNEVFMG